MNMRKNWWFIPVLLAVVAAACAGGYCFGRQRLAAQVEAERELNIRINRSELDGLGAISEPIFVTGHKSPDSDAVCSAIGYAALLRQLGYDARPVVLGKINGETKYILEQAGLDAPELLEAHPKE